MRGHLPVVFATLLVMAAFVACAPPPDARTRALEMQNEAHAMAREGRLDEAIARYGDAIALAPDLALLYHGRGVVHSDRRDYLAAVSDFDRALELDPQRAATYLERGQAYYALEDFAAAEADLQRAIDISGNDPDIVYPARTLLDSIRSGDASLDAAGQ